MKRTPLRTASRRHGATTEDQWTRLAYDDAWGIDGDIEALLDLLQEAQGGSRNMASAELVRRLSFAA